MANGNGIEKFYLISNQFSVITVIDDIIKKGLTGSIFVAKKYLDI